MAEGLPSLNRAMRAGKIDNPHRIAAFITTLAVESMLEYNILQGGSNIPTGIEKGYTGRGYIQLTGKVLPDGSVMNYSPASRYLGVDLVSHPELAQSLDWSAKIATWYWTVARPKTNEYADALQMGMVNKMIGFPEGPGDSVRCRMFAEALRVLTGEVPDGITCSRMTTPAVAWSSSEPLGQWSTGGYLVNNNIWNGEAAGTQTIYAYSPHSWYVVADHSRKDVQPGAVKSYPDTQRNFTNRSIDSFAEITSTFDITCPAVGEYNATYDCWIGGIGSKSTAEVMVWVDHRYPASIPPRNAVESTKVTIDGVAYTAWWRLNGNGGRYIALVMDRKTPAGSVDLLNIFRWLVSKGWLKGSDLVAAVEFGVEISNTGDGPQTFKLNNYTLTAR